MDSIWIQTTNLPSFPALQQNYETEAVIIGGGLAGILTSYMLNKNGIPSVILEANRIASGQTQNSTAKITLQHGVIYSSFIKRLGYDKTRQYVDLHTRAMHAYSSIISQLSISCDYQELPSFLYTLESPDILMREARAALGLGIDAEFVKNTSLPFSVKGALKYNHQAQFHPLKFIEALLHSLTIFEQTPVVKVQGNTVYTEHYTVQAKYIIFATHYPIINMPGYYFMRMHQERSYVLALKNTPILDGMYLGIDSNNDWSFRNVNTLLLLGGCGHRTGKNFNGDCYKRLRKAAQSFYPSSVEVTAWSAQDCMTLDDIPYIGLYSSKTPNWYVATGFRKWGITGSMAASLLLTDTILNKKNTSHTIFSPQRFSIHAAGKLVQEGCESVLSLSRQNFSYPKNILTQKAVNQLEKDHAAILEYDGEKLGVYKDKNGILYCIPTRCPHLGCQLSWNPDEKTWDCPCHGSRFDYKGNLINNPSIKNNTQIKPEL